MPVSSRHVSDSVPQVKTTTTTITTNKTLTYYPAYCYKASPTWFTWVKLTAYDIHHNLHQRPGYQTTTRAWNNGHRNGGRKGIQRNHKDNNNHQIFFYLNHPIQFVQVVGIVVALEEHHDKFWLFTIDDSSGSTIDIHCWKPTPPNPANDTDTDTDTKPTQETLDLYKTLDSLTLGTTLQLKGTLTTYRTRLQLHPHRIHPLKTTTEELTQISTRTKFFVSTLSKPWILTPSEREKLKGQEEREMEKGEEKERKRRKRDKDRVEREERGRRRILGEWEEEERKRKIGAEVAKLAGKELEKKIKSQRVAE